MDALPPFALTQILSYLRMEDICRSLLPASKGMTDAVASSVHHVTVDCTKRTRTARAAVGSGVFRMLRRQGCAHGDAGVWGDRAVAARVGRLHSLTELTVANLSDDVAVDDELNALLSTCVMPFA